MGTEQFDEEKNFALKFFGSFDDKQFFFNKAMVNCL